MDSEASERIKYLTQGPWIERGALAWQNIAKSPGDLSVAANSEAQSTLTRLLRPHWIEPIVYDEGIIRDSFDEALVVYQLYELAIENRYIELDDIKQMVSDELTLLLWSDGARNYLETYGYASVIYLSQRVGIDLGIATGDLPDIRQGTEGRFASFLSQHALWYEDPVLDGWIGFLDDYQVLENAQESDKAVFQEFLDTERDVSANDVTLWTFVAGADRFVTRVADLAASLSQDEKPSYGLFYAYWLAKFYGYRLTADGYVREPKMPDWSAALCNSKRIAHYNEIRKEVEGGTVDGFEAFRVRDRAVHEFWNNALQHLHNNVQQYGQSVRFGP